MHTDQLQLLTLFGYGGIGNPLDSGVVVSVLLNSLVFPYGVLLQAPRFTPYTKECEERDRFRMQQYLAPISKLCG